MRTTEMISRTPYRDLTFEQKKKRIAAVSRWQKKNKERHKLYMKHYRENNPLRYLMMRRGADCRQRYPGHISTEDLIKIYQKNIETYGGLTCYLCKKAIDGTKFDFEHKVSRSVGGVNHVDNIEVAHHRCNRIKHTKAPEEVCIA